MAQDTPLARNASGDRLQVTELLDGIGGYLAETSFERDERIAQPATRLARSSTAEARSAVPTPSSIST